MTRCESECGPVTAFRFPLYFESVAVGLRGRTPCEQHTAMDLRGRESDEFHRNHYSPADAVDVRVGDRAVARVT